jgi:hypothetical protein
MKMKKSAGGAKERKRGRCWSLGPAMGTQIGRGGFE